MWVMAALIGEAVSRPPARAKHRPRPSVNGRGELCAWCVEPWPCAAVSAQAAGPPASGTGAIARSDLAEGPPMASASGTPEATDELTLFRSLSAREENAA